MKIKLFLLLILLILCLLLGACADTKAEVLSVNAAAAPQTISDIAFDFDYSEDHIVYIRESSEYTPYIVVTGDYQGYALLLRENVLDTPAIFNPENVDGCSTYYPDSEIAIWLENIFQSTIDAPIESVKLEVTSEDAMYHGAGGTEYIDASVFLLSATEVCFPIRKAFLKEGNELQMFQPMDESRIAYTKDGKSMGWWLRTPDISLGAHMYTVSDLGYVGNTGIYNIGGTTELGIRPAFCVDAETKIRKENDHFLLV